MTLTALAVSSSLHAQSVTGTNKPFSFGGALGVAIPVSDLSNAANAGFNGTLIMGLNTPSLPVNFRIDGAYNSFGVKHSSTNIHVTSFTGNAVLNVPTSSSIRPYLIGGAGLYNTSTNVSGTNSANNFGVNVGAGLTMPFSGFNTFVEARYHWVNTSNTSTKFFPITFGIMF